MEVREVGVEEYGEYFNSHPHVFINTAFTELNKHKVNAVRYLVFEDGKVRFGIILGETTDPVTRQPVWRSPFSAPFGGFDYNKEQTFDVIDSAVIALKDYVRVPIRVTLPPAFYDPNMVNMLTNSLMRHGTLHHADVNYHFNTVDIINYERAMDRNGRNKLRQAELHFSLSDIRLSTADEAYEIIRQNRAEHGYPLRMSLDEVKRTVAIIPADFFTLSYRGSDVAAAQVFHVAKDIVQVIYWGDVRKYSDLRPMNYLAYSLFSYYHDNNVSIVDVGPSTEEGVPNNGLCSFKRSVGCHPTLKYTFEL